MQEEEEITCGARWGCLPESAGVVTVSSNGGLAEGLNGCLVAGEHSGGSLTHGRRLRIALEG